jgi:molybdopterin/thiamine biosynthesis adenylyltransferase
MPNIKITDQNLVENRFSRFELISWWDQKKMKKANVLVIGAGALGNEIIKNCCLLGIGNILIADMDTIENSNLSRSILYREGDNGKYKAIVASEVARQIYPEVKSNYFNGNIVHDLGLGVYHWADVIIGGLDNREARVSINKHARFLNKTWIDGAIETLDGVARVFCPDENACYECTMNKTDWQILQNRRSCALMTRDQMLQGRVPTTPTTSSIIAGIQTQEAIKVIHGMEINGGTGLQYSGLSGDIYKVTYKRKADCMAHNHIKKLIKLGKSVHTITIGEVFAKAKAELGDLPITIELSRDIITALFCPNCSTTEKIYKSLGNVKESDGFCKKCKEMRIPETVYSLEEGQFDENMTWGEIGVPPFDIINARNEDTDISFLFDGDANSILGILNNIS